MVSVVTRIVGIAPSEIDAYWPTVLPFIERALAESGSLYSADAVRDAATKSHVQIWVIADFGDKIVGIGVTEVVNYASGRKVAWIFALAGAGFDGWSHHIETIEAWSKSLGCDSLRIMGRAGWVRKLRNWRKVAVVLEKKL